MKTTKAIFTSLCFLFLFCSIMFAVTSIEDFQRIEDKKGETVVEKEEFLGFEYETEYDPEVDTLVAWATVAEKLIVIVWCAVGIYRRFRDTNRLEKLSEELSNNDEYPVDSVVEYIDLSITNFKRNMYWVFVVLLMPLTMLLSEEVYYSSKVDVGEGIIILAAIVYAMLFAYPVRGILNLIFASNLDKFVDQLYQCKLNFADQYVVGTAFTKVPSIFTIYFCMTDIVSFRLNRPLNGTVEIKETKFNSLVTGRTLVINSSGKTYALVFNKNRQAHEIQKTLLEKPTTVNVANNAQHSEPVIAKAFCPYCGSKISVQGAFCAKCGQKIEDK